MPIFLSTASSVDVAVMSVGSGCIIGVKYGTSFGIAMHTRGGMDS